MTFVDYVYVSTNIGSAKSNWNNESSMVLLYFYSIRPNSKKLVFVSFSLLQSTSRKLSAWVANPLIDQCDIIKFEIERSIEAAQFPAALDIFYTISPDFFSRRVGCHKNSLYITTYLHMLWFISLGRIQVWSRLFCRSSGSAVSMDTYGLYITLV